MLNLKEIFEQILKIKIGFHIYFIISYFLLISMHNRSQSDSNLRDASLPISYEDITSRIQRLRQASSSYTSLPKTSENEKYFS